LPHKLLITPLVIAPKKYKEFLSFFELVTGEPNTLKFNVENIGQETFPGGEIKEVTWETPLGITTLSQLRDLVASLPAIKPKESHVITLEKWVPWAPGICQIKMKIKSKDDSKIEYYQRPAGPPMEDEWFQFFYAVDRHHLDQTLLLKQLLAKRR